MSVKYSINHIPKSTPYNRRPGIAMVPKFITIHSTGNLESYAANERGWLTDNPENKRTASYHIVVDEKEAIEVLPLNEVAWHAGDGRGNGNMASIGIEICESGNRQKTLENAVELVVHLLKQRSWGVDKLRRHWDWSKKSCPRILMANNWAGWENFKMEVAKNLTKPLPKVIRWQEAIVKGKVAEEDCVVMDMGTPGKPEHRTFAPIRYLGKIYGAKVDFRDGKVYVD